MRESIYKCNICKIQKAESNHWFMARILRHDPENHMGADDRNFTVMPWSGDWLDKDGEPEANEEMLHLCGRACVGKAMDNWMDEVSG